jgi:hypothetical protein
MGIIAGARPPAGGGAGPGGAWNVRSLLRRSPPAEGLEGWAGPGDRRIGADPELCRRLVGGRRRPRMADYVTVAGSTDGAIAAGCRGGQPRRRCGWPEANAGRPQQRPRTAHRNSPGAARGVGSYGGHIWCQVGVKRGRSTAHYTDLPSHARPVSLLIWMLLILLSWFRRGIRNQ